MMPAVREATWMMPPSTSALPSATAAKGDGASATGALPLAVLPPCSAENAKAPPTSRSATTAQNQGRRIKAGISVSLPRRDDAAVFDVDDAIGEGLEPRIVGNADHRCVVLGGGAAQQADDHLAVLAVQRRSRFVGEQQGGALGDGAGDGDALLLAAGQLARPLVHARLQTDLVERLDGDAAGLRAAETLVLQAVVTCCRAVRAGNRLKPWKMKPQ